MNAQIDKMKIAYTTHQTEMGLVCLNTKFQKQEGKLWTYTYLNNAIAQLDYMHINKKWINNAPLLKEYLPVTE